jgi:hypothetical protein
MASTSNKRKFEPKALAPLAPQQMERNDDTIWEYKDGKRQTTGTTLYFQSP